MVAYIQNGTVNKESPDRLTGIPLGTFAYASVDELSSREPMMPVLLFVFSVGSFSNDAAVAVRKCKRVNITRCPTTNDHVNSV
jgi:hypothetical protein